MIILTPETKTCMSHLLAHETSDHFSFIEGEIIWEIYYERLSPKEFFLTNLPKKKYALETFRD